MNWIETAEYKGFSVEINPVPEYQFDFGDFGWAFQVFESNILCFRLVVKSAGGRQTEANKNRALEWGKKHIRSLIDNRNFESGTCYCYLWTDMATNSSPERVDCEGFLLEGR